MPFEITPDVCVRRDEKGYVCQLQHLDRPYLGVGVATAAAVGATRISRRELAEQYLREVMPHFDLQSSMADRLSDSPESSLTDDDEQLRFVEEKSVLGNSTVSYAQTMYGIPVWGSGMAIQIEDDLVQVIGSQSSLTRGLQLSKPTSGAGWLPDRIDTQSLATSLGIDAASMQLRINDRSLYVYRYDDAQRLPLTEEPEERVPHDFYAPPPGLNIPPVPSEINDGRDYIATQVLFTLTDPDDGDMNWIALIEVQSGTVLYVRPLVSCFCAAANSRGSVFLVDPISKTGDDSLTPTAGTAALNAHRDSEDLLGLAVPSAGANQELVGEYVKIVNVSAPIPAPPTSPPPGQFVFDVPTDDFSAVNAYYHCDRLFRLVEEFGFDVQTYFDGTSFPVRVDHRATINGRSNTINAQAPGNAARNGSDGFRFALAAVNTSVGLADDWRIVLHEFGHTLLWDNVKWPNFRFAHSAGDSLAAILNDPENSADRAVTFPWVPIDRRHNRKPEDGWAWRGPKYDPFARFGPDRSGYLAEQMLSSTMFRIYEAAGGGSPDIESRRFASHYVVFLIIKAIGLMSEFNNPRDPEGFADILMLADRGAFQFRGVEHPVGVLRKVLRWGFERQGAYPAPGTPRPVMEVGGPPDIDLYVDDGRAGEYEFHDPFSDSSDIWVRHLIDLGTDHQAPRIGQPNFVFVRVKNRGSKDASSNVNVRAFSTVLNDGHAWPADWTPLTPDDIQVPSGIPAKGEAIVGPFTWTPRAAGETILAVVASEGDPSNADRFTSANPIPTARLVSCDNNMALRTM